MNLSKYFERIKINNTPKANEEGLYQLQSSQLVSVPFENIDCFLHRPIPTDSENLERKILENRRGGYCFELNGLFSSVLESLGFSSRPLLARVMYRGTGVNSRTHIIILVEISGKNYIADVGFGGPGTFLPVPFELDREDVQSHGTFRIVRDEIHQYLMQKKTDDGWFNIYGFNLDTVYPADLLMSIFFTSTYPESHFRHNLIMALHLPNGRITLLNRSLTSVIDKITVNREITDHNDLLMVIKDTFGIRLEREFNFSKLF